MCLHSCTLRAVVSPGWDTSYPAWRKHCLQGSILELCKIMAFWLSSRNNAILCFVCLFLCCGLCSTAVISTLVVFLWNKIVLLPDLCSSCVSYPAREYSRVKRKSSHSWILLQWNFDIKKGRGCNKVLSYQGPFSYILLSRSLYRCLLYQGSTVIWVLRGQ